jgi:hypothetical protein
MKIVKVTYTTQAGYAEQNKANIQQVMAALMELNNDGIKYDTCVCADGKTFVHTAFFKDEEGQQILFALPSFKQFQEQLKASQPETPPKSELLTLVGASYTIF